MDAPLPSAEAGYAYHAAPAYTLVALARAHAKRLEQRCDDDAGLRLVAAEADFLARAIRLVAACEFAQIDCSGRLQRAFATAYEEHMGCLERLLRVASRAIAPGFEPERDAAVPALFGDGDAGTACNGTEPE